METIKDLNSKWWYRLLKVVYVGLFVIALIGGYELIVDSYNTEVDNKASFIKCENGQKFYLEENNFYISWSNELRGAGDVIARSMSLCAGIPVENFNILNFVEDRDSNQMGNVRSLKKNYELVVVDKVLWGDFLITIFLIILFIPLIFELIRRSFYYVILGSLRPKKE